MTLVLTSGERAAIVRFSGNRVWLRSPVAAAPGARIDGRFQNEHAVSVKAQRSVLRPDGEFDVEGRFLDLTRALRTSLMAALAAGHGPD